MSKMGRPPVPASEAKTQLRGAMFARDEAKALDRAVADSGLNKSEWIRQQLLWAAKRVDVWPNRWKAKDLDGKTVRFSLMETPNYYVRGTGRLLAIQRGNGSVSVRIITRNVNETDPLAHNDVPISQYGIDLLKEAPEGEGTDFILIDPRVP